MGCIVTARTGRVSLHHLDGDNTNSIFPNLVPLGLDFHNGLKNGLDPKDLRGELKLSALTAAAERHFTSGHVSQAYGCMRLAHALSAHFVRRKDRDIDAELQTVAHALYFLRRCIGEAPLELTYAHLEYLLNRELPHSLGRVLPAFGAFCLLVELASWVNECGASPLGLELLRKARKQLRTFHRLLRPKDVSRFQRQLANACISLGQAGAEFETALDKAIECDSGDNSELGVANTRMFKHLGKGEPKVALSILKERFEYFEKETDYFFAPLAGREITIMTSLGYTALSLLCESQLITSPRHHSILEQRLRALHRQEKRLGRTTAVNRVPGLADAARSASSKLSALRQFLDGRVFPILPNNIVASIKTLAQQL